MRNLARRNVVIGTTLIVTLLMGFAPRVNAASKTGTVAGTFINTNYQQTLIGTHGGDSYYYVTFENIYYGDLTGTAFESFNEIVHSDGSVTAQLAREVCNQCTLAGRTGAYSAAWDFIGATTGSGAFIFTHGSGGLAGLVGGGSYVQTSAAAGTYSYNYYLP